MRLLLVFGTLVAAMSTANGQTPAPGELGLVGDRFKPLTYDQMTAEQQAMTDNILAGQRRSMGGPFNVLLRSPEMGDLAQQLGAYIRFRSSLPDRLNELAIIMTARHWTSQYEWYAHRRAALQAGLDPAVVEAIAEGRRPDAMQLDEEAVYNFCDELLRTKQVSDTTFETAAGMFGERGVVDLIGALGYYSLVAMALNVDRYPLPEGVEPELKPLQ